MSFNAGENFEKAKTIGSVQQDLNSYKCPSCGSPFFLRGSHGYMQYAQCLKTDCLRVDLVGPDLPIAKAQGAV